MFDVSFSVLQRALGGEDFQRLLPISHRVPVRATQLQRCSSRPCRYNMCCEFELRPGAEKESVT